MTPTCSQSAPASREYSFRVYLSRVLVSPLLSILGALDTAGAAGSLRLLP